MLLAGMCETRWGLLQHLSRRQNARRSTVPNIQVIDGADNCTYDLFEIDEDSFYIIFPVEGQDVEFADDFFARVGERRATDVLNELWKSRLNKKSVHGIHATLFFGLEKKKVFYPTKKESDMSSGL